MGKQDNVIRLVLIEDAVEDAEQLVSFLRNGGIAVRPTRAESLDHLTEYLKSQPIDMVLANPKSKTIPFAKVTAAVAQSGKDMPVLALVSGINDDMLVQAHLDGATRIALRARPEHLVLAVKREFENVSMRRATRRMEALLKESERRCTALLDSSRDPICFIHEGMHVRANQAYLDIFGFEQQDEIEGTPILDMIAPDAAASFKELLKRLSKGEKPPTKLEVKAQRPDGAAFDAVMEFVEATYEGEPCHQITFRRQQTGMDPKELEKLRSQDLVTGLYNRQYLLADLDRAVTDAASGKDDLAFLLLEPDNFKTILDQIGLGNSDILLSDMAQTVKAACGPVDVAARFSDSSFAMVLRNTSHEDAVTRAQTLQKAFEGRIFEVTSKSLTVNVSVAWC
jgi:multidomain signaling protein FimX